MINPYKQVRMLIWEHLKIRKRHFILTFLELCLPIVIFVLVSIGRSKLPSFNKEFVNATYNDAISERELSTAINIGDTKFLYSPRTRFTSKLARDVQLKLNLYNEGVKGFDSKEDILRYYKNNGDGITVLIDFYDVGHEIPENFIYTIQMYEEGIDWQTDILFDVDSSGGEASHHYLQNQFLAFQWALDTSYIEILTKAPLNISMNFEEFPYPPHWVDNGMNDIFVHLLPLLVILSFIFLFPAILKVIVEEKSSGMKQLMKINGLKSRSYWLSWFINAYTPCFISTIVISALLTQKLFNAEYPSLQQVLWIELACLILLYCAATITFIFSFSVLFKNATLAMITSITLWILVYLIYASAAGNIEVLPLYLKLIASLIPPIGLYNGFQVISVGEIRGTRVGFTEQPRGCIDDMTMAMTFLMLTVDAIFYLLIAICCETDPHGKYRITKFYQQVFQKRRNETSQETTSILIEDEGPVEDSQDMPVLQIIDLTKKYGNFIAVNKLNFSIYDKNLTVILGHNGAGKTTTMSILAGLEKETSGELIINEKGNVNLKDRQLVSICPQENMLFSELTVDEHLVFFGKLKGIPDAEILEHVNTLLKEKLKLEEKRNNLVKTLSGGMKRKLSIGIAIMGKPKVVILDEPTAGIDPEGRRDIWDVILECKNDSNIIMSTHLIEEAEELADRVAIFGNGRLLCYGSPMFLKKELGAGYRIQIFYKNTEKSEEIKEFLKKKIDAKITEEIPNKKIIECCVSEENLSRLSSFLNEIDNNKLSIINYKVSSALLENVFLNLLEKRDHYSHIKDSSYEGQKLINRQESVLSTQTKPLGCSPSNFSAKFDLICKKKIKILRSMIIPWVTMIGLFYLLSILTFTMNDSGHKYFNKDGKTLPLQLNTYGCTNVYFEIISTDGGKIERMYEHLIESSSSTSYKVENISEAVINVGIKNIVEYRQKLIAGAKMIFDENLKEITVMYGSQAIHGAPISLNLITNLLVKYLTDENHAIIASNTPLHSVESVEGQTTINLADNLLHWMILLSNACLFAVIMFSAIPTLERNTFIKTLSRIYNLNSCCYWLHNYFTDIIFYLIIITPVIFILIITSNLNLIIVQFGGVLILILILIWYGITMIPYTYIMSFWSKSISSTVAMLLIPNMSLTPILTGIILLTESIHSPVSTILLFICSILNPHVILTYTLSVFCQKMINNHNWDLKTESEKKTFCAEIWSPCCDPESIECANDRAYLENPIYLIISTIVALILLCVSIYLDREKKWEVKKVDNVAIGAENILKKYGKNKIAVKDLSFKVLKGECYGLLGVNGAGKSTTFKILTKQEQPTKGKILIGDLNSIGYCPQEHAIINSLTGRELLWYFGKLRNPNLNDDEIQQEVNYLLLKCGLEEYGDLPCGTYSGGNKRKLNTCIALIGTPAIITLDEPTTGVDPENRKKIRDLIAETKANRDSAIIFTSHSMDECEQLCDKLSIMKAGKVQTGENLTVQELKEKYNVGHIVQIKMRKSESFKILESLKNSLLEIDYEDTDNRNNLLTISVKNSNWKSILEEMEKIKKEHEILDYLVKESSLEEVFLKVAKT